MTSERFQAIQAAVKSGADEREVRAMLRESVDTIVSLAVELDMVNAHLAEARSRLENHRA